MKERFLKMLKFLQYFTKFVPILETNKIFILRVVIYPRTFSQKNGLISINLQILQRAKMDFFRFEVFPIKFQLSSFKWRIRKTKTHITTNTIHLRKIPEICVKTLHFTFFQYTWSNFSYWSMEHIWTIFFKIVTNRMVYQISNFVSQQ